MEKLYFNGDILTMEGEGRYVEAVLVADGKIKAAGTYAEVTELKSDDCELIDLKGKTLMPSFIDGHGHITMAGPQYLTRANLEDAKCFDDIVAILKKYIADNDIQFYIINAVKIAEEIGLGSTDYELIEI